jgi:hypothetical protein
LGLLEAKRGMMRELLDDMAKGSMSNILFFLLESPVLDSDLWEDRVAWCG